MKHTCGTRLLGMLFKTKKGDKVLNFSLLFFFFFRIRSLKFSIKYCEIDIEGPQLEKKKKKVRDRILQLFKPIIYAYA